MTGYKVGWACMLAWYLINSKAFAHAEIEPGAKRKMLTV